MANQDSDVMDFSVASDFSPYYCMDIEEMKNPNHSIHPRGFQPLVDRGR